MRQKFDAYFDKYEFGLAMLELESFFWDFCDNYIELVKVRLYNQDLHSQTEVESAKYALYSVLLEMLKMFSIYMPFVTEEIYQNTFKSTAKCISVHKLQFAKTIEHVDTNLIDMGNEVCAIVCAVRGFKTENKISLKTALKTVNIVAKNKDFVQSCLSDIKDATCAQQIVISSGKMLEVKVDGIVEN